MNTKITEALSCPICNRRMNVENRTLYCEGIKRHCYDMASSGYVNMTSPGQSNGGDSKVAVRARTAFLDTEHYRPISDTICKLLKKHCAEGGLVVDAGCGEGYYSVSVASCGYSVAGFDLSKFATEAAAKRAKREALDNAFFGVASVFDMPVADGAADAVINVFAPCVEQEYKRVLSDDGALMVVYAGPDHLLGLKRAIYEKTHINEERADLPCGLVEAERERLQYQIKIFGNENIKNLFAMTPYYWRTSQSDFQKLEGLEELETEIDIIFAIYKK